MVTPSMGLPASTAISTVYWRDCSASEPPGRRLGSRRDDTAMTNSVPMMASGTPTGLSVNIEKTGTVGSVLRASISNPWTSRLVLVPMRVQVPPSTAA